MTTPLRVPSVETYTVRLGGPTDFDGWRAAARPLALAGIAPERITWQVEGSDHDLFAEPTPLPQAPDGARLHVPRSFIDRAQTVICHSEPTRFDLVYRLLLRLGTTRRLMEIATDAEVIAFTRLEKAVRRDTHKMRAFVRFTRVSDGVGERYVAWFEPDHFIVERNAPFFMRRFTGMRWAILTPKGSVEWDCAELHFGPPATRAEAPPEDAETELWRTYFSSIFNPARLKVKAMQAEMPKKYWRNLPEAPLIPDMIRHAEQAASDMIARMPTEPAPHHAKVQQRHWAQTDAEEAEPAGKAETIDALARQAAQCRRCPLYRDATQTVFGEGPHDARLIFVGEQPGDQEDIAGRPFVGPAGRLFDSVLQEAGIDRRITYVTNAVKHFKFEPRGKRRIHSKPNAGEIKACNWWLAGEIELLRPDLAVALGVTAVQSLLGKAMPVTKLRGQTLTRDDGLQVFITVHPSYLLRIPQEDRKAEEHAAFLDDMRKVKAMLAA